MIALIQNDPKVPAGIYGAYLREQNIEHRLIRLDLGDSLPEPRSVSAALVLGGFMGVCQVDEFPYLRDLKGWLAAGAEAGLPIVAICLGGQLLAEALGGEVRSGCCGEHGVYPIVLTDLGRDDPLFAGIGSSCLAFQWHNDSFTPPPGALHLAASTACPGQVFRFNNAYGLQFHPEVDGEIVSAWSAVADSPSDHLSAFAKVEPALHNLSLKLLANFLSL